MVELIVAEGHTEFDEHIQFCNFGFLPFGQYELGFVGSTHTLSMVP